MSNKYEIKMLQRGFVEFKNIISAFIYLMDVGAITEIDLYREFHINDGNGNYLEFYAELRDEELEITFMDHSVLITPEQLKLVFIDDDYEEHVYFDIKNPNEINNEESFFQASTLYDLTDVEDGYIWFTTIMDCYTHVVDMMESDGLDGV